jgi:hypothetical protein
MIAAHAVTSVIDLRVVTLVAVKIAAHAVTSATVLHVHPLVAMTAARVVTSVTDLHVVTLVAAKTVAHAATSVIVLHGHPLETDQLARALVTDHHVRTLATGQPAQAEHRAAAASASSVDPDQAAAAHVDQRSSVLSADSKNILSNTFRQDVFLLTGIKLAVI